MLIVDRIYFREIEDRDRRGSLGSCFFFSQCLVNVNFKVKQLIFFYGILCHTSLDMPGFKLFIEFNSEFTETKQHTLWGLHMYRSDNLKEDKLQYPVTQLCMKRM